MDERRQEELVRMVKREAGITPEECSGWDLQELIFLIHSAKSLQTQEALTQEERKRRIRILMDAVKDKLLQAEELYIAYDVHTRYPYLDANGRVWIFSKEAYAREAQDYYLQQLIQLDMKRMDKGQLTGVLATLHLLGMEKVLVDNGKFHVEISRDELLPPPDWSGTPRINIPVTNPKLQHAMILFFQNLYSKSNFEGKKQQLRVWEGLMIEEVLRASYLVPMRLIEKEPDIPDEQGIKTIQAGTTLQFATIRGEDQVEWLPAFTDWTEFEKAYDKTVWGGNVVSYKDLVALSEGMGGIVINVRGIAFRIHDKNKKAIGAYRTEKADSMSGGGPKQEGQSGTNRTGANPGMERLARGTSLGPPGRIPRS
ncbi:SseB family protein [Paenibacillus sp. CC-CFT747]|nr:SseB family protein [Paenibacillus sp. CC-CFT747]